MKGNVFIKGKVLLTLKRHKEIALIEGNTFFSKETPLKNCF